jgi:hypothetical protein
MDPPVVGLVKLIAAAAAPLQYVALAIELTVGVGLTSTVAVIDAPRQPLAVGMIVKVTVMGALVVFVKVPLIFPEPLPAIPVTVPVLSLVQLNVVPVILPVMTIVVIVAAEQIV